ncbi:hypothetical protein BDW59DRAFT_155448 [Aspergillus cavernicola]|uniref:Uncharacterized protein n=1 Tax=Aspergillus cavernicola TaxID=176166 RepID=A0ABR4H8P7_9EURO
MVLRQPSLSLWHLATVLLKIYIPLALSVSDCPECRPLDLQRAPGVGIDLTMAYVTASIRFRNGTTRPLAVINGTAEYRAAMQLIVEEGMNPEDTPWPLPAQSQQNTFVPSKGWGWWIPWATYPDPIPIPDHYTAIGSMLATLKLSVLDPLEPPLKYNSVYLSVPDIPNADWHYTRRFELPCSLAGLEMLGGRVATSHALRYNGVKDWVGPGDEPPPHIDFFYPRNMLTISYNAASLGITLSTRDAGWLFTGGRVHQSTRLGADNVNKIMGYWDEVRKLSANIIGAWYRQLRVSLQVVRI